MSMLLKNIVRKNKKNLLCLSVCGLVSGVFFSAVESWKEPKIHHYSIVHEIEFLTSDKKAEIREIVKDHDCNSGYNCSR